MEKRKTLLMVMLCLVLAALICAAAVFGYAIARSAYTDTDGMYAGEARWKISEITEETDTEGLFVGTEKLKPEYTKYDTTTKPKRTKEWFGLLAVVENDSEVKADISFTCGEDIVPVTDGCGEDDSRYSDEEILMHFEAVLYCCLSGEITSSDDAQTDSLTSAPLETGEEAYIYASITWITDLERDIDDEVFAYDGSFGDEFDSWAGEHLAGLYLPVTIRAEQAE